MKEICKQHQRWINTVKQFGIDDFAEDVVQEAYLKCLEKETVNEAYFYLTLRSLAMDLHRKQKQIIKVSIDEILLQSEIDKEINENLINVKDNYWIDKIKSLIDNCDDIKLFEDLDFQEQIDKEILKILKNSSWFDLEVFILYYKNNISMRTLSNDSTISLKTCFESLKRSKIKLIKKLNLKLYN